ncbi:MAG: hypothetical protein NZT92_15155 [Abditibacteriales bacterium]|nr:hypothetical protein [Abditibacteriales bacterium]
MGTLQDDRCPLQQVTVSPYRLIAGDSLLVMNSLLEKGSRVGKVQMIDVARLRIS